MSSNTKIEEKEKLLKFIREICLIILKDLRKKLVNKLDNHELFNKHCEIFKKVLIQTRYDKNKIYSICEPQIYCISKGKKHKK
jgi:IS5 family transposase